MARGDLVRFTFVERVVHWLVGFSLGYVLMKNLWVSAGYNWGGYSDRDFSQGDWTTRGPFVSFRYKFDQETVKELLDWAE